jgi:ribonucleoside-diphosphate reductase alpha chain
MDDEIQREVMRYGIRNSHLTSIAPTGTISLCADNISSGIEPVFSHSYNRKIITPEGPRVETVDDYGLRVFGVKGKTANETSVAEHLAVLSAAAKRVDSAVSKTVNVGENVTFDEFKNVYLTAYKEGCKGVSTFRTNGKREGILTEAPKEEVLACTIDPQTGARSCE